MPNVFVAIILLLLPLPALSAELPSDSVAELSPSASYGIASADRPWAASAGSDLRVRRELELQTIERLEELEPPTDEAELRLPDEELPKSDIPLTLNGKVEYMLHFFQTTGRKAFSKWLSRSERYIPMMKEVLRKEGLPEDLVYLAMIESGFSPHAYSVASAVGPWQFMSGTGKRYSLRIDPWIDERRDPLKSTVAAALYLKELYSLFNNDWYLAAAGYNAGENKILRAINMYNTRDFWEMAEAGSYLKRETKDYVPRLLAAAIIAKDPARYGFADVAYLPPIEFDTVAIPSRTDLEVAARLAQVPYQTLKDLNPELKRWCTPPDYPEYRLKIPKGRKELFEAAYASLPEGERFTERAVHKRYRAGRKETLESVARRFGTSAEHLARLNGLKPGKKIAGRTLTVPVIAAASPAGKEHRTLSSEVAAGKVVFKKYYTVRKGDTIASVARRFNISEKILLAWNSVKGRLALRPGKRIIIGKFVEKNGSLVPAGHRS